MTAAEPNVRVPAPAGQQRRPEQIADERYRAWRATVEALPGYGRDGPQVLLLVGPDSSLSTAGVGVARAFAQSRQRTLLLDGSGIEVDNGEPLNGSRQAAEDLLAWIASGVEESESPGIPEEKLPLLLTLSLCLNDQIGTATLQRLLAWSRRTMDRTVVVVRPLDRSADGLLLARWVDCVILGVRPGVTTRRLATQARNDLVQAGGTVVGSVCLD